MNQPRDRTTPTPLPEGHPTNARGRLLAWCAELVTRRPVAIIILASLLGVLGAVLAGTTLRIDADTNSLISDDRPFMRTYRAFMQEFGDLEYIYVVVDAGVPGDHEAARSAVDALLAGLRSAPDVPEVHGVITPEERWRLAPRAMSDRELSELTAASGAFEVVCSGASPATLLAGGEEALARLSRAALSGLSAEPDEKARRTGAEAIFLLETIAAAPPRRGEDWSDFEFARPGSPDYLRSETGRMYFIEIMPEKDYGSLAVIERPLEAIRTVIEEVRTSHPGLSIGVTGKPVLQADEMATTEVDMTRASIIALSIITILFMIVLRGVRYPLLMVLAFAVAFGWTYGAATLLVGRLNLLSMVFMLVLVGVGLDYGVHVIFRWREARRTRQAGEAVHEVIHHAATGNLTGALTSAGVFLLALLTSFQGLRELGTIAGIGLLFCLVTMTLVLPALLLLRERHRTKTTARPATTPVPDRGLAEGRGGFRILMLLAVTATSVWFVFVIPEQLRYESNLLELQANGLESVQWEHRLFEDDSSASWFGASIVDTIEAVPEIIDRAGVEPAIGGTLSVLDLVEMPTPARDAELSALRASIPEETFQSSADGGLDPIRLNRAAGRLRGLGTLGGERLTPAETDRLSSLADRLEAQATVLEGEDPEAAAALQARIEEAVSQTGRSLVLMAEGATGPLRACLPAALRARFISPGGRFLVMLEPSENIWTQEPMATFVAAIRRVDPEATGVPITQYESMNDMASAFLVMASGAVLLVLCFVWWDFRSIALTLVCMGTLALGILWTLGILGLCGIPINLANFFAIPILIGLGIDSAVHVVHRWHETAHRDARYGTTLKAVCLTAVTTAIGFGTLLTAEHRGLASLGWVMLIGSLCCLAASAIVLPQVLRLLPPPARAQ